MTTDADKIRFLASRAVRKKEARIRGAEMMDLPALRVYWAKHRSLGRPTPDVDWEDLDVLIAALDALEARLDAATVLIRDTDAFLEVCDLQTHGMLLSHFCIFSEPRMRVREWLAGDKEEHSDRG